MSVIKPHIQAMSAYSPPLEGRDPKSHLLLDFNERTLPISAEICQALIEYIQAGRLQMYPSYGDVVARIAQYCDVEANQLMITNGSDQGIELIFRSVCSVGDEAIIPAPSFAMYKQCAGVENLTVHEPHYTREGGFPVQAVLDLINAKTKIICIANPNNPSGTLVDGESILAIAKAAPQAAILVDECYFEYAKATVAAHVETCPNIIITRTFSKTWGMPSLRIGYIIAAQSVIKALLNVRGPYDINQLAVVAVKAALDSPEYTRDYVNEVMTESKPALESFLDQRGIPYWPSHANYVWAFFSDAGKVEAALRDAHILVRPKADSDGNVGLRITLGDKGQTERLLNVLTDNV